MKFLATMREVRGHAEDAVEAAKFGIPMVGVGIKLAHGFYLGKRQRRAQAGKPPPPRIQGEALRQMAASYGLEQFDGESDGELRARISRHVRI